MVDAPKNKIKCPFHQALPAVDSYPTKNAIKKRYLMVTSHLGAYSHPALPQALYNQRNESRCKEVN